MMNTLAAGDRAGGGHHHRQGAAIGLGGLDHGAVAGEIGLRGQHVHHLRAGDARHELHGEAVAPAAGRRRKANRIWQA
jgi:hypothetical protein